MKTFLSDEINKLYDAVSTPVASIHDVFAERLQSVLLIHYIKIAMRNWGIDRR